MTLSIGVAKIGDGVKNADDLIGLADKALYEAKNSGQSCVRAHEKRMVQKSGEQTGILKSAPDLVR